jgi:hypothetical protein
LDKRREQYLAQAKQAEETARLCQDAVIKAEWQKLADAYRALARDGDDDDGDATVTR